MSKMNTISLLLSFPLNQKKTKFGEQNATNYCMLKNYVFVQTTIKAYIFDYILVCINFFGLIFQRTLFVYHWYDKKKEFSMICWLKHCRVNTVVQIHIFHPDSFCFSFLSFFFREKKISFDSMSRSRRWRWNGNEATVQ